MDNVDLLWQWTPAPFQLPSLHAHRASSPQLRPWSVGRRCSRNIDLDHETVDSDESDDSDYSDKDSDGDSGEDFDEDAEASEDSDDDGLHDSDSEDLDDQGEYGCASFSDDEEDFDQRNNFGKPYFWVESEDSYGFSNGVGQVGSYERCW